MWKRPAHAGRATGDWRGVRQGLAPAQGAGGLPAARFHDLRHTYPSTLLSAGVAIPAAAEFLGHTPAILLGVYGHLMAGDSDRARAAVQAAFAGSGAHRDEAGAR
jgi:integrase